MWKKKSKESNTRGKGEYCRISRYCPLQSWFIVAEMNLFKERSAKLGRLAAQVKSVLDLDCPIGSDIFQDLILFFVVRGENIRVCAKKSD